MTAWVLGARRDLIRAFSHRKATTSVPVTVLPSPSAGFHLGYLHRTPCAGGLSAAVTPEDEHPAFTIQIAEDPLK
jgi:hypothetical protein